MLFFNGMCFEFRFGPKTDVDELLSVEYSFYSTRLLADSEVHGNEMDVSINLVSQARKDKDIFPSSC